MFKENLTKLRKEKGLSQEDLASILGVARQTISKWELGETSPDLNKLQEISTYFNISLDELVGNEVRSNNKKRFEFEYISKKKIFNIPLVHIHVGIGLMKAKGIIAIGNISMGFISIGIISLGIIALGVLALGLIAFGSFALGLISFAAIALGLLSFGGVSIGYLAFGGLAIGNYAIGGCAIANSIGYGGYANGKVAFDTQNGLIKFSKDEIGNLINNEFPKLNIIKKLFISLGK